MTSSTNDRTTGFKGSKIALAGKELKVGDKFPAFQLVSTDMADLSSGEFEGKNLLVIVVPSLDTPICSTEAKRFNTEATNLSPDLKILVVSRDLPFAQKRWCGAEGVENLQTASDYKYRTFGEQTGTLITDWQLLSRAIFVVNAAGTIQHVEYVPEVSAEPNYEKAISAVKAL
jgi:thioredoxin-dependent peroxiredoxin